MSEPSHEISERDPRNRPAEIMDDLERGERNVATREGHRIGAPIPTRHEHRTVSRADFAAVSRGMPRLDDRDYPRDMDGHVDDDPFAEFVR
ncbi:hypothetical protein [Herbidospora cretacea]|uniref:hypothetical protein n=1 Tax=Herbidospora cretacea TaxID=28444 RepID=UPI0007740E81|nr:hypothetical protein [Herbidospora cretacea]